jgi:hypothetical protein
MKLLHILSESGADAFFYERIAERVTGASFTPCDIRLRKGDGESKVRASIKLLLSKFPKNTPRPECALLLALDNDRCPDHPGTSTYSRPLTSAERRRASRWRIIQDAMLARWGENRGAWPVDVAVAVPVEMIESWILLLLNPNRGPLPLHSLKTDRTAIVFHDPLPPGPQLKDLAADEARQRNLSMHDLMMSAAEYDLAAVENVSPSFKTFVEDLRNWTP